MRQVFRVSAFISWYLQLVALKNLEHKTFYLNPAIYHLNKTIGKQDLQVFLVAEVFIFHCVNIN